MAEVLEKEKFEMEYLLHLLIITTIYVILAQSLSLSVGYTGLVSLSHSSFFGIGAYTTAILCANNINSMILSFVIAFFISFLVALIISSISIKTIDDYFTIITLGIQVIFISILNNWGNLTKGSMGLMDIPPISIFSFKLEDKFEYFLLCILFLILNWKLLKNIELSPFGRILIALSEDEIYTMSLGKNINQAKIVSFTISSMIATIPGILFAHYIQNIDPTIFSIDQSIYILCIVIIGGMRSLFKIAISTIFLLMVPEVLRYIGLPSNISANMHQIIYGFLIIIVIFKSK